MTHPVLTNVDGATLQQELAESKQALEQLTGTPCTAIAYPTGKVDARVVAAAEAAGYVRREPRSRAASAVAPGRLAWPRVGVRGDDSIRVFRLKCSRAVRGARSSWLRGPMRQGRLGGRPRGAALDPPHGGR